MAVQPASSREWDSNLGKFRHELILQHSAPVKLPPKNMKNILGTSALKGNLESGDIYHIPDKIQYHKDVNSAQMVL